MTMPTLFKRASGSIPQGSSHESCTLPPLVVNTVASRYQRGYTTIFPHRWLPTRVPVTYQWPTYHPIHFDLSLKVSHSPLLSFCSLRGKEKSQLGAIFYSTILPSQGALRLFNKIIGWPTFLKGSVSAYQETIISGNLLLWHLHWFYPVSL